jgi:hypothetical protein
VVSGDPSYFTITPLAKISVDALGKPTFSTTTSQTTLRMAHCQSSKLSPPCHIDPGRSIEYL